MKPTSWSWRKWFWYRVIVFALRRAGRCSRGMCANRYTWVCLFGPLEMTVVVRDTRAADGYSREELVEMLATVREYERLQGWHVLEPRIRRE
jgi:hypothetical protein